MAASPIESVEIEVEAPAVADAEVIADTDEDDGPQPNVAPDGRPIGPDGRPIGGVGKTKRPAPRGGGRKPSSARPARSVAAAACVVEAAPTKAGELTE